MIMHTAEPLVFKSSPLEVQITALKSRKHRLASSDEIPTELIQAGSEILLFEIHKEDLLER
jgi:hypothetical protein